MDAVVVGGGVAGAAAAIALRLIGAEVTVYEAYPDPAGAYGSFVSLAGNGLRALDALGCLPQIQQAGFPVARQRMWSGRGKLLGDVPRGRRAADPLLSVTLMRSDLVTTLRREAVRLGARVVVGDRVVQHGDARLTAADVIIGADGIWSTTRRSMDPAAPEPVYAGMYTVSGTATSGTLDGLGMATGSFNMTFGRRGAFIYLPAPDGSVWWSAQVSRPDEPNLDLIDADELAAVFRTEPRAAEIIRGSRGPLVATLNHVLGEVDSQQDGRVVLIGDAAHPVGAGQGASMAIEDAVVLGRRLAGSPSVADALATFETERRGRLGKMAKAAGTNRDAKTAGPVAARVRNLVMPLTFNRFYEKATGWLYDYDPGTLPAMRDLA